MPSMSLTKPRKKRCVHQPEEAPFPIPIETITHKPASNRHWFFYQAQMIDNNVIVQNEGDIVFLSKMGFFGKGILSRSKPEHQFFASSFQGIHRKNLPPKERRFQQQRFQQVRQHKYERHLSWQKQLMLQRRQHREVKESKTAPTTEDCTQNPSYRVPTGPAKRVKRATISKRNQRAGIVTMDRKRERPEMKLVPESGNVSMKISEPDGDSKMVSSNDALVSSTMDIVQPYPSDQDTREGNIQAPDSTTLQRVMPSRNWHGTEDVHGMDRIKSPRRLSGEEVTSRPDMKVSSSLHGTDDSEESKFVFQSQDSGVRHTSGSCEKSSSCLPNADPDRSSQPEACEKMSSTGYSELVWETRHADWADCMEVGRAGEEGQGASKELPDSSGNKRSAWSPSSWRTDPQDWNQDQEAETKLIAQVQSGHTLEQSNERENIEPLERTESESCRSGGHDRVTDGATTTGSCEQKRSSGHPSWSEGWTSDPRDWDMGEGDAAVMSRTQRWDQEDSEEDHGFDKSCEVSGQQNSRGVVSNKLHRHDDVFVVDERTEKHQGSHDGKGEPSTSESSQSTSFQNKSEEQLLDEMMDIDFSRNDSQHHSENLPKENVRKSNECTMDSYEENNIHKSQESRKAPERDSECNHSNADDAFVAVPTPVEFEDATTSQTESNNILSLKGRDARKKIREVKTGPVRHRDPYPIFEYLQLSYEEAFFLSYGLGCLNLKSGNKNQMDLTEMWRTFRRHQPNFVANYIVYHFFRSKGWVPKTGLKFGADFILYKKGPPFYHASYCVYVSMINEEDIDQEGINKMNWASLMGMDRVIENAAKELMFCFVIKPSKLRLKDLDSPACIPHFKVQEIVMKRWVPSRGRQQDQLPEGEVS